jgi:hypothetical protein
VMFRMYLTSCFASTGTRQVGGYLEDAVSFQSGHSIRDTRSS